MASGRTPPAGTVAFVFSDIEGSTALLRRLGGDYADVLEQHRVLLRRAWSAHDGYEVDSEGDGFFVAFDTVPVALSACARAQRALGAYRWRDGVRVRVRMGVHSGLAAPVGSRYVAMAVHQAARVASTAHGGQVLVSEQAARDVGAPAGRLTALGSFRVRDFDRPIQLHQLTGPGLRAHFPAVRAVPAERHNFLVPGSRLVGRGADVGAVEAALAANRLVTVVGPGGVGKTRLATEVGIRAADGWTDGVWNVDCAAIGDASLLPGAMAAALGLPGDDATDWDTVVAHLRARRTLVVLDGCERHTAALAEAVERVLRGTAQVSVLVTSREPLRVDGEVRCPLDPLPTDDARAAGIELFVERTRAVRPDFRLDDTLAPDVVALCRRLDGLPLALEIAAARMPVLQPAEISAGLDRPFRIMRLVDRNRPARQRALDALMDWSVSLLSVAEAAALRRLALLSSSFDLETAVAAVAGPLPVGRGGAIAADEVPELVWSLVERSLLVADPAAGGTRYRLLQTVRAYGLDLLRRHGETGSRAEPLAAFYVDRLGPAHGTGRPWVDAVATDLDNVRSLMRVAAGTAPALAQDLACTVARYHDAVQSFRAGVVEVTRLAAELTARTPSRVGLLTALGDLCTRVGDTVTAERHALAAAALRARVGAPNWDEVGVEKVLGEVAIARMRPGEAVAIARAALRSPLRLRARARMYNMLGIALATAGDTGEATAAFEGELAAAVELGDEVLLAHAYGNSAEIAIRRGDHATAARHQRAGLDLAVALGQPGMVAYALLTAAQMSVRQEHSDAGDWRTAVGLAAAATLVLRETGFTLYPTDRATLEDLLASASSRLGPTTCDDAYRAGASLALPAAIRSAENVLSRATAGVRQVAVAGSGR